MVEHPPTFDPESRRVETPVSTETLQRPHGASWDRPGAVGDEDALSDGQRAVVPHQQEVKDGV